jgi:hypothetical protein
MGLLARLSTAFEPSEPNDPKILPRAVDESPKSSFIKFVPF